MQLCRWTRPYDTGLPRSPKVDGHDGGAALVQQEVLHACTKNVMTSCLSNWAPGIGHERCNVAMKSILF